jgi:hypothetical protein
MLGGMSYSTAGRLLPLEGSRPSPVKKKRSTGHVYAHALTLAYARQARAAELAQTLDVLAPRVGGAEARLDELQRSVAAATERADEAKAALSKHGTFEQEQRQVRTSGMPRSAGIGACHCSQRPASAERFPTRPKHVRAHVCTFARAAWPRLKKTHRRSLPGRALQDELDTEIRCRRRPCAPTRSRSQRHNCF